MAIKTENVYRQEHTSKFSALRVFLCKRDRRKPSIGPTKRG